jgi:transposase
VLYTMVLTCRHLRLDPLAYLREALVGLFALGDKPTAEQLSDWLPDRWLLRHKREGPANAAS